MTVNDQGNTGADPGLSGDGTSEEGTNNVTINITDTITLTGTVYSDEGTTDLGAGKTVRVAINGTDIDTAETIAGGNYSIDLAAAAGDVITVYLEDETEDAVAVTVSDGANLAGLDLYQNYLIVRHDNAGSLSNANLATGTVGGEDDISNIYSTSGGNLTVEGGNELFIWTGDTFAPGGNLTVDNIDIDGTLTLAANTATVSGDWDAADGSFSSSGLVTFNSLREGCPSPRP